MLHRGCHGHMFSTRGRMSKEYYHDIAKMPEFGEDEHGIERILIDTAKVGFQHKNSKLKIINQADQNEVINVDDYNRDDSIIYLAQKHKEQERVKEQKWWERAIKKKPSIENKKLDKKKASKSEPKTQRGVLHRDQLMPFETRKRVTNFVEEYRRKKNAQSGASNKFSGLKAIQD